MKEWMDAVVKAVVAAQNRDKIGKSRQDTEVGKNNENR